MSYSATTLKDDRLSVLSMLENPAIAALFIGFAVFLACMVGIVSRPFGLLATLWPANPIMLGILLRVPASATPLGWVSALGFYIAADLMTGADLRMAVLLNGINVVGITVAYFLYRRFPPSAIRLADQNSAFYLIIATGAGAITSGLTAAIFNPMGSTANLTIMGAMWAVTEFANYVIFLPVILAASRQFPNDVDRVQVRKSNPLQKPLPLFALIISCLIAVVLNGPGAIAFTVPALLWCSIVYPILHISVLTLLIGIFTLTSPQIFLFGSIVDFSNDFDVLSFRLGTALVTIAPIILASVMQVQHQLLGQLHYLAHHDVLTNIDNRAGFLAKARRIADETKEPFSILAMDLDHFKTVNDTYGHQAGDIVLRTFADRVQTVTRSKDVFARIGGEEFILLLPDATHKEAGIVAERVRKVCAEPIEIQDGKKIDVTVSIGLLTSRPTLIYTLDQMFVDADRLLYLAKRKGRNRIERSTEPQRKI